MRHLGYVLSGPNLNLPGKREPSIAAAAFTHASMGILDALKPACFSEGG